MIYTVVTLLIAVVFIVVASFVFEPEVRELAARLNLSSTDAAALEQLESSGALQPIFVRVFVTQLMGLLILALVSGIAISTWLGWRITHPIVVLDDAMRKVSSRDVMQPVKVEGSVEVQSLAASFNHMVEALEAAEKRRQNLLADVSHELRTPLTILQGNLRGALDDIYTFDKEQVTKLYNQTRQLHHLINDLHDLAQAEADRLPLKMMGVDFGVLVEQAGQLFVPLAEESGIQLMVTIDSNVPMIRGDKQRLMQVLQNLIANALRYARTEIHLVLKQDANRIILQVIDDGVGIESDELPHIFDRFYRTDRSRTRETGGTGLGLAIVQSIVKAHDGTIAVKSLVGKGTTFTISLTTQPA